MSERTVGRPGNPSATVAVSLSCVTLLGVVLALVIALFSGFTFRLFGLLVRLHHPERAALFAIATALTRVYWARRYSFSNERRIWTAFAPPSLAFAAVIFAVGVGLHSNQGVAAGADAYGYVSQADLWLKGDLKVQEPWVADFPWPDALWTTAPLGYRPAANGLAIVPTYAAGLPILFAGAKWVAGQCAIAWLVPLTGGLLVALTYGIGKRTVSPPVGAAAAWLIATSPVVLYMLGVPMSDVPAAAFFAVVIYGCLLGSSGGAALAGCGAAIFILIRPNLVPLPAVVGVWLVVTDFRHSSWQTRLTRPVLCGVFLLPGIAVVAFLNAYLYGSATSSGYGDLGTLFSLANVSQNVRNYSSWLVQSQTLIPFAGILALLMPGRWLMKQASPAHRVLLLISLLGVIASYLAYMPFQAWWFLRFLLPAWPVLCVGTAWSLTRTNGRSFGFVGVLLLLVAGSWGLKFGRDHYAFDVGIGDQRYVSVAQSVREATEPNSVILAMQHSGSVRYYGGRMTLRYDHIERNWLDRTVSWLAARGKHTYILLDDWEVDQFQKRFPESALARLDGSTLIWIHEAGTVAYLFDTQLPSKPPRRIRIFETAVRPCCEPAPMADFSIR